MLKNLPIIGIVGGIGSGKSTVASILESLGCFVADADANAKLVINEKDVQQRLIEWWGRSVVDNEGVTVSSAIAEIIFADRQERVRLESLLHPRIRQLQTNQFNSAPLDSTGLVIDAPLLFESGLDSMCDAIIFIQASRGIRLERVKKRNNWDEITFDSREATQLPLDKKSQKADYVVHNEGDRASLEDQLKQVLDEIKRQIKTS